MNILEIRAIQRRVGTPDDGIWGVKSRAAVQEHLRRLMPARNPWPKTDQASLTAFYGRPGDESQHTRIAVTGLGVIYDGRTVREILCHRRVAEPLLRIITALSATHPQVLAGYAGCYNNRPMRGGSLPSLHARAAAIDFCPGTNGNNTPWHAWSDMPLEVMETFAREGWLSAGAFWGRDAMHFQATQ